MLFNSLCISLGFPSNRLPGVLVSANGEVSLHLANGYRLRVLRLLGPEILPTNGVLDLRQLYGGTRLPSVDRPGNWPRREARGWSMPLES